MSALRGRHALVTGGGTGVGAAIALALAGAGATVTICGRRAEPLAATAARSANVRAQVADITDEAQVRALFEAAGPTDIVVANAGAAESAPLASTGVDLWQRMLAVNLTGSFLTLQAGLRQLQGRDWGRLIPVASSAGLKGYRYVAAYCAAKHGVIGLMRALALETAGSGVTVNALCPGFTETPLLDASVATIVRKTGKSQAEARAALAASSPLGRFVRPEEVAAAALWLCGPGSDAVTGQAIGVNGGETA